MDIVKTPIEKTGHFSQILVDYVYNKEKLRPFYGLRPEPGQIARYVNDRPVERKTRSVLVDTLKRQYKGLKLSDRTGDNIAALAHENTFTITTGHQLNIFTGPLYFIYKIVTAINTAKTLNAQYPDQHFVPVYWMASEDHDFEEINHFRLFGKQYTWNAEHRGPVGRLDPGGLKEIIDAVPDLPPLFSEAYLKHDSLSDATRYVVNALFGADGIVVLDADDTDLKHLFVDIMQDDLTQHTAHKLVEKTTGELTEMGYKSQVHPRAINLFYMKDGLRSRIVEEDGHFSVLDTGIRFSQKEILSQLHEAPARFSPNVVLRPVYQEVVLPNVVYIGGPAEIAYWLQLKSAFDHFKVPFPILLPRNFALMVANAQRKKMAKLGLAVPDLFRDIQAAKDAYLQENARNAFAIEEERSAIQQAFKTIAEKARTIDPTLEGFVGSEEAKTMKSMQNIEKRLKRAEEENEQTAMQQIEGLYDKLFPGGTPQERADNFLNFYINDPDFLDRIKDGMDPFDMQYHVLLDND
jgi:bacillithiol biosynthesis cysteine-adding enzyme BshC